MEIQMLKVKNATNDLVKILFFLSTISVYSQKEISGTFSVDYELKDFVTIYHFFDNNIFTFKSSGDLGLTKYGKGHYMITKDSLFLNFDLTELKENSYHRNKTYSNNNDSIQVKFIVKDFESRPLSNIKIWADNDYVGQATNKDGIAMLKFKKQLQNKSKIEIHIEGELYIKHLIYIYSDLNYEIDVFLNNSKYYNNPTAIKYSNFKYKILEFNNYKIKLLSEKGITTWSKTD